jgi:hypothetical protein
LPVTKVKKKRKYSPLGIKLICEISFWQQYYQ